MPTHPTPSATDKAALLRRAFALGYSRGHSDGIGCGHDLAPRCQHDPDDEAAAYSDELTEIAANLAAHNSRDNLNAALEYVATQLAEFKPDALRNLGLDVAAEKIAQALANPERPA